MTDGMTKLHSSAPVFLVSDIAATKRWYEEKLGFAGSTFPQSPPYAFCILQKDGVEIMFQALRGHRKPDLYPERAGGVWNVYIRMDGVRDLFERLSKDAEVAILEPVEHHFHGDTSFTIRDPDGYVLVFSESDPS